MYEALKRRKILTVDLDIKIFNTEKNYIENVLSKELIKYYTCLEKLQSPIIGLVKFKFWHTLIYTTRKVS